MIRQKFQGAALAPEVQVVDSYSTRQIGPFKVTWLPITHSTPETHALLIETKAGNILHTADWKIDPAPVIGPAFETNRFSAHNLPPLSALVVDSTNALKTGHSKSEQLIKAGLKKAIGAATGRVIYWLLCQQHCASTVYRTSLRRNRSPFGVGGSLAR